MPETLFQLFARRLDESGDTEILTFLGKKGAETRLTWSDFLSRAAASAETLKSAGVTEGEILPIMREIGADLVCDFFGAVLLGAIPCVLAPPNPRMAPEVFRRKLLGMLGEKTLSHLVCDAKLLKFLAGNLADLNIALLSHDALESRLPSTWLARERDQSAPLFLQHSSGTTGVPKAVMIRETQLLSQLRSYGAALSVSESDKIASWLPLYHDMGMVACLWGGVVWGLPTTHMSNFSWALRPAMLLETISRGASTLCWLPNFAFSFMAANVKDEELTDLDLSSMRAWVSCSEPVYQTSYDAFAERFAGVGVQTSQMASSYAMAENVFAITQSPAGEPPATMIVDREALARGEIVAADEGRTLVSSGRVIEGVDLEVHGDGDIGEFVVGGDCVIDGYFANEEATRAAIRNGRYVTGDLGFIRDGEVFVVGRSRDMIIVGGRNLDPGEVEFALSEIEDVLAGRVCCLGVIDQELGTEAVHVIVETEAADNVFAKIGLAVKKAVSTATSHQVRRVWCKPKGWLIKSSAGKMARKECKAKLQSEESV